MNYNKLYYFVKIAETGNISQTAGQLYISQPSLSLHLKELEESIGYKLFQRKNRQLILSPEGRLLYDWAKPFFDMEEAVLEKIDRLHKADVHKLSIGILGSSFIYEIPAYVQQFKLLHPQVEIHPKRLYWKTLDEALRTSSIDIAFSIFEEGMTLNEEYHMVRLEEGNACFAVSMSHPFAKKNSAGFSEIRGLPLVLIDRKLEPLVYDGTIRQCRKHGFYPNIIAEYPYIEPLLSLVNMNEAITATSTLAPLEKYENIKQIKIIPEIKMWLAMFWKKNDTNPGIRLFVDYMESQFKKCSPD